MVALEKGLTLVFALTNQAGHINKESGKRPLKAEKVQVCDATMIILGPMPGQKLIMDNGQFLSREYCPLSMTG